MRVKLKTMRAGPQGISFPGDVIDLPEHEAEFLINTHGAVPDVGARETATLGVVENTRLDRRPIKRVARPRKADDGT